VIRDVGTSLKISLCTGGFPKMVVFRGLNTIPLGKLKITRFLLMLHSLFTVPQEKVYIKVKSIVQLCYKLVSLLSGERTSLAHSPNLTWGFGLSTKVASPCPFPAVLITPLKRTFSLVATCASGGALLLGCPTPTAPVPSRSRTHCS
jgi:hypothetical protein